MNALKYFLISSLLCICFSCIGKGNSQEGNSASDSTTIELGVVGSNDEESLSAGTKIEIASGTTCMVYLDKENNEIKYKINDGENQNLSLTWTGVLWKDVQYGNFEIKPKDANNDGYTDLMILNKQEKGTIETTYFFDPKEMVFTEINNYNFANRDISNTKGFVKFDMDDENFKPEKKISFYNEDGSEWLVFESGEIEDMGKHLLAKDATKYMFVNWLRDFKPWIVIFEPYRAIHFRCVGEDKDFYHVVINENNKMVKKLKKGANLSFCTTDEHFRSVIIALTPDDNVHTSPDESSPEADVVFPEGMDLYDAIEIRGDWMRVKDLVDEQNEKTGWVRWRKNDRLVVEIGYAL